MIDIEEIFALQLIVFHLTAGIYASRLNLHIKHASRHIGGCKGKTCIPLVERAPYLNGSLN